MKTKLIILSVLIITILNCKKSSEELNIDSLINTKWKLNKITDNKVGRTSYFPCEIDDFEIVFHENGNIDLLNFCNYSFGEYNISGTNIINIINIGPCTLMYCLPDL